MNLTDKEANRLIDEYLKKDKVPEVKYTQQLGRAKRTPKNNLINIYWAIFYLIIVVIETLCLVLVMLKTP